MFGQSKGWITGKKTELESLSGKCLIDSDTINIDRWYGGKDTIHVQCR